MKPIKVVLWFFVVLFLYVGVFYGIQAWRYHRGPWRIQFLTDQAGRPAIVIHHQQLGVRGARIDFREERLGATNLEVEIVFDRPALPIPFGRRLHEDLVSFPGVETFDFFGHQVELLARVLKVNRQEVAWTNATQIDLWATNKVTPK